MYDGDAVSVADPFTGGRHEQFRARLQFRGINPDFSLRFSELRNRNHTCAVSVAEKYMITGVCSVLCKNTVRHQKDMIIITAGKNRSHFFPDLETVSLAMIHDPVAGIDSPQEHPRPEYRSVSIRHPFSVRGGNYFHTA